MYNTALKGLVEYHNELIKSSFLINTDDAMFLYYQQKKCAAKIGQIF
jgi:hypothetical protein